MPLFLAQMGRGCSRCPGGGAARSILAGAARGCVSWAARCAPRASVGGAPRTCRRPRDVRPSLIRAAVRRAADRPTGSRPTPNAAVFSNAARKRPARHRAPPDIYSARNRRRRPSRNSHERRRIHALAGGGEDALVQCSHIARGYLTCRREVSEIYVKEDAERKGRGHGAMSHLKNCGFRHFISPRKEIDNFGESRRLLQQGPSMGTSVINYRWIFTKREYKLITSNKLSFKRR